MSKTKYPDRKNPYAKEEVRLNLDRADPENINVNLTDNVSHTDSIKTEVHELSKARVFKYIHPACAQISFYAKEGELYREIRECPKCGKPLDPTIKENYVECTEEEYEQNKR